MSDITHISYQVYYYGDTTLWTTIRIPLRALSNELYNKIVSLYNDLIQDKQITIWLQRNDKFFTSVLNVRTPIIQGEMMSTYQPSIRQQLEWTIEE